jgi:hypothetical protein
MKLEITDEMYEKLVELASRPVWTDDNGDAFRARDIWLGMFECEDDQENACFSCYETGADDGQVLLARELIRNQ